MDPAQLATESAAAAFLWNLLIVLLLGLGGGGLLAGLAIWARARALRDADMDHWPHG